MLAHQKASEIKAGDELLYRFRWYQVTESVVDFGGVMTQIVGRGPTGGICILVASSRKFWILKEREHHDPLHGLRGWRVPVWRRPELPRVPRDRHLPVLSWNHVVGEVASCEAGMGPGALAIRTLVGSRVRTSRPGEVSQVPYVLSVAGSPLLQALHAGRCLSFGVDGSSETLGGRSMVPNLCAPVPPTWRPALGRDWPARGAIRIVIPRGPQE